jgi:hypothetical protein
MEHLALMHIKPSYWLEIYLNRPLFGWTALERLWEIWGSVQFNAFAKGWGELRKQRHHTFTSTHSCLLCTLFAWASFRERWGFRVSTLVFMWEYWDREDSTLPQSVLFALCSVCNENGQRWSPRGLASALRTKVCGLGLGLEGPVLGLDLGLEGPVLDLGLDGSDIIWYLTTCKTV